MGGHSEQIVEGFGKLGAYIFPTLLISLGVSLPAVILTAKELECLLGKVLKYKQAF